MRRQRVDRTGVKPIRPPEEIDEKKKKIQATVEAYTYRVIQLLIGSKGMDEPDVIRHILREWIQEHRTQLDEMGVQPPKVRDAGMIVTPDTKTG